MIIKINGVSIDNSLCLAGVNSFDLKPYIPKSRKEAKKLRKLSVWLWSISGTFFVKSHAFASSGTSMWKQMSPLWGTFQDVALVLGGIAIFVGMLTFLFKRNLGKQILVTSALVVGGCFLVPSVLMLIAIVGSLLNDVLMGVFDNMNLKNSVQVGGN
ncbi:hypothetical protein [Robertmurraya siralis]|uniref:hypothetical protein n=1 Tax=Robertmurraya siralis TaxID=77777 RepID=UPI0010F497D5|nr:hypothetical protein [Robertmurraya siralis]